MVDSFRILLSGNGMAYSDEEIAAVVEAMREADPQTQGRYMQAFEDKFSGWNGSPHSFVVSSCTAALELAAVSCELSPENEVICPAHTFCATAIPFGRTGARIRWADIDLASRVVTADTIRPLINERTKVIVVVHLYGLVCDMEPIMALASEHNLLVVEDCAQSLGAMCDGVKCGNFGDFGCFSFHTHKNITTLGEGGMLTVKSAELAVRIPGLRHDGLHPFPVPRERYWVPAMSNVEFDIPGQWPYNFCIGEAQCALGIKALDRVNMLNSHRAERAQKIFKYTRDYPEITWQQVPENCTSAWYCCPGLYDGSAFGKNRDDFTELMVNKHRIQMCVQFYPLNRYPLFIESGNGKANIPNTDRLFDNMISFPFHEPMSDADFDYLLAALRATMDEVRG